MNVHVNARVNRVISSDAINCKVDFRQVTDNSTFVSYSPQQPPSLVGPTVWNALNNGLRDPELGTSPASVAYWRRICFSSIRCIERIRGTVR